MHSALCLLFFFNDTATTEIYTLSLHDALPICRSVPMAIGGGTAATKRPNPSTGRAQLSTSIAAPDRKSTRLNSSHSQISYAVFCLKKKKKNTYQIRRNIRSSSTNNKTSTGPTY